MTPALLDVPAVAATSTPTSVGGGGGVVTSFLQSRGYKSLGYCPLRSNTTYRRQGGSTGAILDLLCYENLPGQREPLWEVETTFTNRDGFQVTIRLSRFFENELTNRLPDLEQLAIHGYRALSGQGGNRVKS